MIFILLVFSVQTKLDNYTLNLCGPLVGNCGNTSGASGCQTYLSRGKVVNNVIGYPATSLTLVDGQLSSYNTGGTKCGSGTNRWYSIEFVCDPTTTGSQGPVYVSGSLCSYVFNWRTSLVCHTPPPLPCSYDNQTSGVFIDFSPLRNQNFNWQFTDPATGLSFELNVCQNLVADQVC